MIEDKHLLLRDMSARIPYGVKLMYEGWSSDSGCEFTTVETIIGIDDKFIYTIWDKTGEREKHSLSILTWKPFLRSMSSMTKEEKKEYDNFLFDNLEREDVIGYEDKAFGIDVIMRYRSWEVVQWLLEHHLDFNGLIDLGLALEARKGIYD